MSSSSPAQGHAKAKSPRRDGDERPSFLMMPTAKKQKAENKDTQAKKLIDARVFCEPPGNEGLSSEKQKEQDKWVMMIHQTDGKWNKAMFSPITGYLHVWVPSQMLWLETCIRHPGADRCVVCNRCCPDDEEYLEQGSGVQPK